MVLPAPGKGLLPRRSVQSHLCMNICLAIWQNRAVLPAAAVKRNNYFIKSKAKHLRIHYAARVRSTKQSTFKDDAK